MIQSLDSNDMKEISKCTFFQELNASELRALGKISICLILDAGTVAYEEGAQGDSMWVLLEGSVLLTLKGKELGVRNLPGETFGQNGFLENAPRSATMKVTAKTKFLVIPSVKLWQLIDENPMLGVKILKSIAIATGRQLKKTSATVVERSQRMPHTKYHLDPNLVNRPVNGNVFSFDLKVSELLLKNLPRSLDPSDILNRAIFPFRLVLFENRGIEFRRDGDGGMVFFPQEQTTAIQIVHDIVPNFINTIKQVSKLLEQDIAAPSHWELNFRVVIVNGALKPGVHKLGDEEIADWQEGINQPLTETARLMEIEKTVVDPNKEQTSIVLSKNFMEQLRRDPAASSVAYSFGDAKSAQGKHGRIWEFFVQNYSLVSEEKLLNFKKAA